MKVGEGTSDGWNVEERDGIRKLGTEVMRAVGNEGRRA